MFCVRPPKKTGLHGSSQLRALIVGEQRAGTTGGRSAAQELRGSSTKREGSAARA